MEVEPAGRRPGRRRRVGAAAWAVSVAVVAAVAACLSATARIAFASAAPGAVDGRRSELRAKACDSALPLQQRAAASRRGSGLAVVASAPAAPAAAAARERPAALRRARAAGAIAAPAAGGVAALASVAVAATALLTAVGAWRRRPAPGRRRAAAPSCGFTASPPTLQALPFAAPRRLAALGPTPRCLAPRGSAVPLRAYTAQRQAFEGAPIAPPPDLPSLLLDNRIVYLGSPITSQAAELVIAQLLYLNYASADKPVTMYINSTGSTLKNSTRYIGEQKVGSETDAFAIADVMAYIKPQVMTIAVGQAYGTAAMLLGLGAKGKRFALPNVTIMLSEPREPSASGLRQAEDLKILAQEMLHNRATMAELLARGTDKTEAQIVQDTQRCYYMSPDDAVAYGLIDKVLTPDKVREQAREAGLELPSFMAAL